MATEVPTRLLTAEEFMASELGEGNFELVRGEVIELPPSMPEHGVICANITSIFWNYGKKTGIGFPFSNDAAVVTERDPDTLRGADVCFYTDERWPRSEVGDRLPPMPPSAVIEVYSASNRPGGILKKVGEYLAAGIPLVIVAYPKSRTVAFYRFPDEPPEVLKGDQVLENVAELPGFSCPVADLFV
jgi:Uma2 family endonuclease